LPSSALFNTDHELPERPSTSVRVELDEDPPGKE
jgi:hypothetical protein